MGRLKIHKQSTEKRFPLCKIKKRLCIFLSKRDRSGNSSEKHHLYLSVERGLYLKKVERRLCRPIGRAGAPVDQLIKSEEFILNLNQSLFIYTFKTTSVDRETMQYRITQKEYNNKKPEERHTNQKHIIQKCQHVMFNENSKPVRIGPITMLFLEKPDGWHFILRLHVASKAASVFISCSKSKGVAVSVRQLL